MDQQYIYTIFFTFMLEMVQSQAYDAIKIYSILNPEIIYIIENTTHDIHCLI